jgi:predicted glycosyltransferase involved in capsule biosynthesis
MKISFCTTCSNRLYQFEKTIDNTYNVVKNNPDTEWVIVNYGSKDNLHQFMLDRLKNMSNRVVYVNETSGRSWHASCAKNVAHTIASGDVLLNLDCDNFIGNTYSMIKEEFTNGVEVLHIWSGVYRDGTYGRIATNKNLFFNIGGYDEKFPPMSGQDCDLLNRAIIYGAKHKEIVSTECVAIKNSKEESIRYANCSGLTWEQMCDQSRMMINEKCKEKISMANLPEGMSKPIVEIYKGELSL